MSNTSYSFKENSHVIVNQGGEKKVMKKILSVALSTAMAFSMFASVAFGADAKLTPEQQFNALKEANIVSGFPDGLSHLERTLTRAELAKIIVNSLSLEPVDATSYNDKNYANHWGRPYIEAATQAGILNGKDAVKKLFDPNGAVTVQELAKVLVTALKLEVPADANNTASAWAKGYVAAAVNAGYLADGINYQAQATRSQAVVAAYAIYEAAQVPTVKSYNVVDSKNVEFTLSNGEVVKVALEKALEPNKATEVTFKTADGKEIKASVTWVVTEATKVESASADNLKEVVVNFDGEVEKKSAETKDNYTVKNKTVESATLLEGGKSVKLLLTEASTLENQKETEVKVKNVKSATTSKLIEGTVKFTPVDVKMPEASVVGLGTKAFKVTFSEPVKMAGAVTSNNYKVDGKTIGATIDYSYPNVAILSADLEVGTHKLVISNVEDFSGLKIAPVEIEFTVAEDNEAPQPVAVTTNDLKEATIEFNEPVKSLDKAYFNSTVNGATFTKADIKDNKVTLHFSNPLNLTENTIYLEGVTDYSNNKANREIKVTPVMDTERPTVVKAEIKQDDTTKNHKIVIEVSEDLDTATVKDKANYKITDKDGKVFSLTGLNKDGRPVLEPVYDSAKKTITIDLAAKLDDGTYTLDVSGLKDTAYVPNVMLPFTTKLSASSAIAGEITRSWVQTSATEDYLYIQFSKAIKTDGEGSALVKAKYTFDGKPLTDDMDVQLVTADTVRLVAPAGQFYNSTTSSVKGDVTISLVQDTDGNYITNASGGYVLTRLAGQFTSNLIQVKAGADSIKAVSQEEVKVVFEGKLSTVYAGDFKVKVGPKSYTPTSATLSDDRTTVTLKFTGDSNKLPADLTGAIIYTSAQADIRTQDNFGSKVAEITEGSATAVADKVAPELIKNSNEQYLAVATVTADTYDITLTFNKAVENKSFADLTKLFSAKIGGKDAVVNTVTVSGTQVVVNVTADSSVTVGDTTVFAINFSGNDVVKTLVSVSGQNPVGTISEAAQLKDVD